MIVLSSPREKVEIDPYFDIHHRGVPGGRRARVAAQPRATGAARPRSSSTCSTTELVRVDPMVTHRVAFADAQRAYEGLRDDPETWLGVLLEYG